MLMMSNTLVPLGVYGSWNPPLQLPGIIKESLTEKKFPYELTISFGKTVAAVVVRLHELDRSNISQLRKRLVNSRTHQCPLCYRLRFGRRLCLPFLTYWITRTKSAHTRIIRDANMIYFTFLLLYVHGRVRVERVEKSRATLLSECAACIFHVLLD